MPLHNFLVKILASHKYREHANGNASQWRRRRGSLTQDDTYSAKVTRVPALAAPQSTSVDVVAGVV